MEDTPTKLASIEIVGRTVLIRFVSRSPGPGWPMTDTGQGYVSTPEGFWDRYDKRWIVTDIRRRIVSYPDGYWIQLQELRDKGHRRFVLDISDGLDLDLDFEAVVLTYQRVKEVDGWIGLVATGKVWDLLSLTPLEESLPIFDNREDALTAAESP